MIKYNSIILQGDEFDVVDLDDEKVIMNLEKGKYFSLNVIGSRIWEMLCNEISVKYIIEIIKSEYDVEEEICREGVIKYLNDLKSIELIKVK